MAAQAREVLGALRDEGPLRTALAQADGASHAGVASALAFFDTSTARAALANYLAAGCTALALGEPPADVRALEATVLALAPRPIAGLATTPSAAELVALERADACADVRVRGVARVVLRAWRERWGRDRLLMLGQ